MSELPQKLTLLKIKVLHDAIEEHFLSKWSHKRPFCGRFHKRFFKVKKVNQIIKMYEENMIL